MSVWLLKQLRGIVLGVLPKKILSTMDGPNKEHFPRLFVHFLGSGKPFLSSSLKDEGCNLLSWADEQQPLIP